MTALLRKYFVRISLIGGLGLSLLLGIDWLFTPQLPPSAKPKILITNHHNTYAHGHLTYIQSIISSELRNQYAFAVATPPTSQVYQAAKDAGLPTFACHYQTGWSQLWSSIKAYWRFRQICKAFQPDIIHANGPLDKTFAAWATVLLKHPPKVIRTYHVTKVIKTDIYHRLLCNWRIAMNLFVSQSAFAMNVAAGGLVPDHYVIIENGVDLAHFRPRATDKQLQQALGIPDEAFVFGSCAGLSNYKRIDLMLAAAAQLKEDYTFHVIALGQKNIAHWQQQAKTLGIDSIVHFPGYIEDIRPYCSIFDAGFVLSTGLETASYALREMLAMKIPCIASSYSGLKDAVINGYNGILVTPGSVVETAAAMTRFMTMPLTERMTYQDHARALIQEKFSLQQQLQATGDLYAALLSQPS